MKKILKEISPLIISIVFCFSVVFLLIPNVLASTPKHYSRMIVFGDSYSDNGNDFMLSDGKYPNATRYDKGRFSNGPVWTEFFAKNLNLNPDDATQFINLAYGQAKILSPTDITVLDTAKKTYPIPDLSQQISLYTEKYTEFKPSDLIVLFISANDFFDLPEKNAVEFFHRMADEEVLQIERLIKLGAHQIIVLNGRDVTQSPLAKIVAQTNLLSRHTHSINEDLQKFRKLIQTYNIRLADKLKNTSQVFIYDIYKFDNAIISQIKQGGYPYQIHSKKYIFKNASAGCYENLQGDYQGIAGAVCKNPQAYFFYDRIHTTRNLNYLLAEDVYKQYLNN